MKNLQYILLVVILSFSLVSMSQTREELETKRQEIQQEIDEINSIIKTTESKGKSALGEYEDLQKRIKATERLIQVNNRSEFTD